MKFDHGISTFKQLNPRLIFHFNVFHGADIDFFEKFIAEGGAICLYGKVLLIPDAPLVHAFNFATAIGFAKGCLDNLVIH
ncbi:MAG: hypothetical protein EBS81_09480 [Gammaproteobacteria bacterium]|nr:hypothetical protein [Gammaproteobacteria bacterium]